MPVEKKALYSSPNGDRWFLARDLSSGHVFIRHEANAPSGGRSIDIDIGTFLSRGERHPEHQALLDLIGTLLEGGREGARERQAPEGTRASGRLKRGSAALGR